MKIAELAPLKAYPFTLHPLTYCVLVDSSTVICWMSPFGHFRGVGCIVSLLFYLRWKILLANIVAPNQTPHSVASELELHCLPMTLLQVSR